MDKKNLKTIEEQIAKCKEKLANLKPQIARNPSLGKVYNKLLIRKAVLTKKYKNLKFKPTLKDKLKKLLSIHKREKLICDYFNA